MGDDPEHYLPLISTQPHGEEDEEEQGQINSSRTQSQSASLRLSRREYFLLVVVILQFVVISALAMMQRIDTYGRHGALGLYCECYTDSQISLSKPHIYT